MKIKRLLPACLLSMGLLVSSLFTIATPSQQVQAYDRSNFVICIDPGHDDVQDRATLNVSGIHETEYNLNISLALRDYLQSYGFTVVMTRTDGSCPSGGGDEKACLQARADIAASAGADLLVSIHHNASSTDIDSWHDASGSCVYTSLEYITLTSSLAAKVSQALYSYCGLAMCTPTGYARASSDNGYYADGIVKDYYGVIRHCAEYNIPAVIIEHGFSDNYYDATQRISLGADCYALADASAILNWYEETYEGVGVTPVIASTSDSSYDSLSYSTAETVYSIGSPSGAQGYVNTNDVYLRAANDSASDVLCTLSLNDLLTVFEDCGDFYHVTAYHDEMTFDGYLAKDYVSIGCTAGLPEGVAAFVNTDTLNLRSSASSDSDIAVELYKGDCLTLYEMVNGYYHVAATHDGMVYLGYIDASYIQIGSCTVTGYISEEYQNVYQEPTEESTAVEVLTNGAPVCVLSETDGWYEVQFEKDGTILTGYVPGSCVIQY